MKIQWKKKETFGNIAESYIGYVIFKNDELKLFNVDRFSGERKWCLPIKIFPYTGNYTRQKVNTLATAKRRCEKWWKEFCDEMKN